MLRYSYRYVVRKRYEICSLSSSEDENVFDGCHNKEPEYTKEGFKRMESKKRKAPNISSSPSTDEDDLDNSRLENLHWCKCGKCIIYLETLLQECVCCKGYSDLGTN